MAWDVCLCNAFA
ncbi:hypothetical protein V4V48_004273 [Vibrio mimicus]